MGVHRDERRVLLLWAQADADEARNSRSVPGGNYESLGERTNY